MDDRAAPAPPALPWAALAAAAAILAAIQFSTPNLIGNDGYFHIRYAQVVREAGLGGFPPPFPWLPLTILAPDRYADHHMLYHLLLVPFTLGDLRIGGKLAAWAGAVALASVFVWVLRRERLPLPALGLLALGASSGDFLFRVNMPRVQALSVACLLLGLHFALARRHRALAVLTCVYAWLYDGFLLLVFPVGAVVVADLLVERRLRLGAVVAACVGAAVGLVANPYFPHDVTFILHHFGDKLMPREPVRVGNEWNPYDPLSLLGSGGPGLLYVAIGLRALVARGWPPDRRALTAFLVAAAFMVLMLRSRRFIEYFAPTASLFVALATAAPVAALPRARRRLVAAVLAAVLAANVGGVVWELGRKRAKSPYDRYAPAARYVAATAPPGAMLCTTDWDDFPWLYFDNVESTYLVGLDPTYLLDRFRDAFWLWHDVSAGQLDRPSTVLGTRFPCAYVLSDRDHGAFLAQAEADPGLEEVLANDHMVLYRVRREGPPPLYPTTIE